MSSQRTYKKLGEVASFTGGFTPKATELFSEGKYPYFKVSDMNTAGNEVVLTKTSLYVADSKKCYPKGAIVFPKNGAAISTNKKRILGQDSIVDLNTGVAIFDASIDIYFAHYWFKRLDFREHVRRGALPTLDIKGLQTLPFPLPSLSEQQSIVRELDAISDVIAAKNAQLRELDALAQALFYDIFGDPITNPKGWEIKPFGDILSYIKNGANIKQTKGAGGIPITRIETLSGGVFNRDRLGYADIMDESKYKDFYLESGDLLMSHINSKTYIGRTVMYEKEGGETIIHGMNLLRLKTIREIVDTMYVCFYCKTDTFKANVVNIRKDAVNQSSICISDIVRIPIMLPPLDLQQAFAAKIQAIEAQKQTLRQSIAEFESLLAQRMDVHFG